MRSKRRLDLNVVRARFQAWRAVRRGRAIPERLWRAAMGLLDRHRPTAVCRELGLNVARFKQVRQALGRGEAVPATATGRLCQMSPAVFPARRSGVRRCAGEAAPGRPAALLALSPVLAGPAPVCEALRTAAECRLVLEGVAGARLTMVFAQTDRGLLGTVCRLVLMGPGSAPQGQA